MELALPFVVIWTKNGWELIEKKHCAMFTDTYIFTYHCEIPSSEFAFVFTIGSYS